MTDMTSPGNRKRFAKLAASEALQAQVRAWEAMEEARNEVSKAIQQGAEWSRVTALQERYFDMGRRWEIAAEHASQFYKDSKES